MKNNTTNINGYVTTVRPCGKVSFIMPEVAKTMTQKQINDITSEAPELSEIDSKEKALSELKEVLKKKTEGYSKQAKLEFLVNHCEVESFAEISSMSEWGIKCLIEKLEG